MEETVEILEALQKQDLLPEIIRSEVNSLMYPIFSLNRSEANILEREYKAVIKQDGKKIEVLWRVSALPRYGSLGPFEKQMYRAVEKIINLLPLPINNPIALGSFGNMAAIANLKPDKRGKYGGHVYEDIKNGLIKIVTASIYSKSAIYDRGKRERLEGMFHLYDQVIFKDQTLPDGTIADTNYLFLSDWYLSSINNRYVRPLNYSYLESLATELTRRFYELFGTKFYYILQNNISFIRYKYSTLCQLLPVVSQKYYSNAYDNLNPAHQELIKTGFFEKVIWPKEKISSNPADWLIYYYPGPRAEEEYQKHQDSYQVSDGDLIQLIETNVIELPKGRSTTLQSSPFAPAQKTLLDQLVEFGLTEKVAQERVKALEPGFITDWLSTIEIIPNLSNKRAYLAKALKEKWALPEEYLKAKAQKHREEIIENCSLCDSNGFILLADPKGNSFASKCPHSLEEIQKMEQEKGLKKV